VRRARPRRPPPPPAIGPATRHAPCLFPPCRPGGGCLAGVASCGTCSGCATSRSAPTSGLLVGLLHYNTIHYLSTLLLSTTLQYYPTLPRYNIIHITLFLTSAKGRADDVRSPSKAVAPSILRHRTTRTLGVVYDRSRFESSWSHLARPSLAPVHGVFSTKGALLGHWPSRQRTRAGPLSGALR
jgi:hypothetical protein